MLTKLFHNLDYKAGCKKSIISLFSVSNFDFYMIETLLLQMRKDTLEGSKHPLDIRKGTQRARSWHASRQQLKMPRHSNNTSDEGC